MMSQAESERASARVSPHILARHNGHLLASNHLLPHSLWCSDHQMHPPRTVLVNTVSPSVIGSWGLPPMVEEQDLRLSPAKTDLAADGSCQDGSGEMSAMAGLPWCAGGPWGSRGVPTGWLTELQTAQLRLVLGALLHGRLSSDSLVTPRGYRAVKRDVDVLEQVGLLLVGRAALVFSRAHDGVRLEEGGAVARCCRSPGMAVCASAMHSGQAYAEFTLLEGESATVGIGRPVHPMPAAADGAIDTSHFWGLSHGGSLLLDGALPSREWELGSPQPGNSFGTGRAARNRSQRGVGLLLDLDRGCLSVYDDSSCVGVLCDSISAEELSWRSCEELCGTGGCTMACRQLCWIVMLEQPGVAVRVVHKPPPESR